MYPYQKIGKKKHSVTDIYINIYVYEYLFNAKKLMCRLLRYKSLFVLQYWQEVCTNSMMVEAGKV